MIRKEMINQLLNVEDVIRNQEYANFLRHELELLNKEGGAKRIAQREENEKIKSKILSSMEPDIYYLLKELRENAELENISIQRINALVKQLKDDGKIVRTVEKGKAYFCLA